jgi:hypothetical protein
VADEVWPIDQLPVEELDLIIRTYFIVKKLGVATVGDLLASTSAFDVVAADGSDAFCADDLAAKLRAAGVAHAVVDEWRGAPARRPVPPDPGTDEPWGLLYIPGDHSHVTARIRQVYLAAGLGEDTSRETLLDPAHVGDGGADTFGPDHFIVYEAGREFTVALSMRFELAPVGGNALAAELSARLSGPVYAFREEGESGQLLAYEAGAARTVELSELPLTDAEQQSLDGLQHNLPAMLRVLGVKSYGHSAAPWEHFIDVYAADEDVDTSPFLAFTTS